MNGVSAFKVIIEVTEILNSDNLSLILQGQTNCAERSTFLKRYAIS